MLLIALVALVAAVGWRATHALQPNRAVGTGDRALAESARDLLNKKQYGPAIDRLRAALRHRPDREVELDLVWALEQAGRAEEAARYLQAHPRVWHGSEFSAEEQRQRDSPLPRHNPYDVEDEPDHVSRVERAQMLDTAGRLIKRAAFETSLQTMRCQVCHHRAPTLSSQPVTDALFPDRALLSEAATLLTLVRGLSTGAEVARLDCEIGRTQFKLSELFPPKHREARAHLEQAQEALRRAVNDRSAPRDAWWRYEALNYLGLAAMKIEQWKQAEGAWRRAIALRPNEARAWSNLGTLYERLGEGVQALDMMKRAVAVEPNNAALHTNLGVLLASRRRVDDALREHRRALELDEGSTVARLNYALALALSGARADALREIRETLKRRPNYAAAHNALGQMLRATADDASARREFELAVTHNPAFTEAYRNLGQLALARGDRAPALMNYRKLLEWLPDDAEALAATQ